MRGVRIETGEDAQWIHDFELGTLKLGLTQYTRPLVGRVKFINQSFGQGLIREFGISRGSSTSPSSHQLPAVIYDVEFSGSGIQAVPAWRHRSTEVLSSQLYGPFRQGFA